MALTPQPLRRQDDPAGYTAVLGPIQPRNWRKWSNKFQPPDRINAANEMHPDYSTMADWHGGDTGEDVGQSDATQAIVGRNGGTDNDYEPRHQEEKGENMVPPREVLADIGKDYGPYGGQYHSGTIEPEDRYPSVQTDETPAQFRRSNYEPPEP